MFGIVMASPQTDKIVIGEHKWAKVRRQLGDFTPVKQVEVQRYTIDPGTRTAVWVAAQAKLRETTTP